MSEKADETVDTWHVVLLAKRSKPKGLMRRRKLRGYVYTASSAGGGYLAGKHVHRSQDNALSAAKDRIDRRGGIIGSVSVGGSGRPKMPDDPDQE